MSDDSEWVTIAEAARRLEIDPRQVRRYADKLRGTQDRTPSDTSPVRVRMRAIEALRNGFSVKLSTEDTLSGQGQDRTGHRAGRSPLPDYAALLSEKDARIADLQEQLRERNQAESELRRLMLADRTEIAELRQQVRLLQSGPKEAETPRDLPSPGGPDAVSGREAVGGIHRETPRAKRRSWWRFWERG